MLELSNEVEPRTDGMASPVSEGPIDLPEDSVVDTESSDGQGLIYEEEDDGDHDQDEDYVMRDDKSDESDSDEFKSDDDHGEPTKGKGKAVKVSPFFLLCIIH